MSFFEIVQSQLVEPFRVVLLIALVATTLRTSAQTGYAIPLALGVVFVAAMTTMTSDGDRWTLIAAGIVANAILVAAMMGLVMLWIRYGPQQQS